jgi:hypothetical protein
MRRTARRWWVIVVAGCVACGDGPAPSTTNPQSFLAGSWQGTVTIQVNPDVPGAPPPSTASSRWTFEVVPQTNLQTFRATVVSEHPWLPMTTIATTALVPGNAPPVQISTQGDFNSPRGCRGTFGSFGTAQASRIEADFGGVDCDHVTFTGRVVLTKP